MAKWCPIINEKVVYLQCQECEEKLCLEKNNIKETRNKDGIDKDNQN